MADPLAPGAARPITRLMIANRGEIVVRIARTAHRLGIDTAGVYSVPDAMAMHVDAVDVAVALAGSTPAESYLDANAIIAAALRTGCDALHPGYGFLAENADFARAVADAGLTWVGPTPENIALLGDKVRAKEAALQAGVPTTEILATSPDSIPTDVPMPAIIKAAAGGGGRGMRIVRAATELADAVEAAAREALSAFGDATVFIEPYIEHGRHIEVQIIGDAHGAVVHLGERECSIQRRNQKVIEEAPSAGIDDSTRSRLCEGAVALARHVGYQNAGTVEFLVGEDGTVTFLEVNTRLQVEHPITEMTTGLDLVELQLLVAAGAPLPLDQSEVTISGHAIEARVVAEDPSSGWMPSVGHITRCDFGLGTDDGGRVDAGVSSGSEVSTEYDSLLAKVICHAPTRHEASRRLGRTLRSSLVSGIATNLATLAEILVEPDFLAARTPTSYLDEHPGVLSAQGAGGEPALALLLAAVFAAQSHDRAGDAVTGFAPSGWRNLRTQGQREVWMSGHDEIRIEHTIESGRLRTASVLVGPWPEPDSDGLLPDDERRRVSVRLLERPEATTNNPNTRPSARRENRVVEMDGVRYSVEVEVAGATGGHGPADELVVHARNAQGALSFRRLPRFVEPDSALSLGGSVSPLPGTVLSVNVEPGQAVAEGDLLMVVEAMKMEHRIVASASGVVSELFFAAGDRVDQGELLLALTETDEEG